MCEARPLLKVLVFHNAMPQGTFIGTCLCQLWFALVCHINKKQIVSAEKAAILSFTQPTWLNKFVSEERPLAEAL